jgi:hypothetical protein
MISKASCVAVFVTTYLKKKAGGIVMMRVKWMVPIVLCLLLTGCAAGAFFGAGAAAGVASIKWYQGGLTVVFEAPFMETWDASVKALKDMKLKIERSDHDLTSGKIHATRADEKDVTISLKYRSARETEAVIRVGLFGDKDASGAIQEQIRTLLIKG